jgi:hypothetical protein
LSAEIAVGKSVGPGRRLMNLLDGNFGAAHRFASEAANFAGFVGYHTVAVGVNSVVAANLGAFAGTLGKTNLTDNDLAGFDLLTTVHFNAKALTDAIAGIFGGTACFYV